MKLYEVPRNSRIKVLSDIKVPPGAKAIKSKDELNFSHVDGMYSFCTNDDGEVIHLVAWAEVEVIK